MGQFGGKPGEFDGLATRQVELRDWQFVQPASYCVNTTLYLSPRRASLARKRATMEELLCTNATDVEPTGHERVPSSGSSIAGKQTASGLALLRDNQLPGVRRVTPPDAFHVRYRFLPPKKGFAAACFIHEATWGSSRSRTDASSTPRVDLPIPIGVTGGSGLISVPRINISFT